MMICCLEEMQLEYEFFLVDYFTGAHEKLQYLNINVSKSLHIFIYSFSLYITVFYLCCVIFVLQPTGQVPSVVEDGDLTLLGNSLVLTLSLFELSYLFYYPLIT